MFRFRFSQPIGGLYSNDHDRFFLREEHIAELKRLVREYNRQRLLLHSPLSMSDLVNACLDFVFSHKLNFKELPDSDNARDFIAREVYRRAFFRFIEYYEMF